MGLNFFTYENGNIVGNNIVYFFKRRDTVNSDTDLLELFEILKICGGSWVTVAPNVPAPPTAPTSITIAKIIEGDKTIYRLVGFISNFQLNYLEPIPTLDISLGRIFVPLKQITDSDTLYQLGSSFSVW